MTTTQHVETATKRPFIANGEDEPVFSAAHKSDARRARAWLKDRIEKSKKLPHGELICEAVEVTPAMAEIMLAEHNEGNRPLKPRRFQYAEDMKAGDWKFHSQGISLSKDGLLNNGQNRLTAVVLAGVDVRMMVAFGEDRDVFPVIDTGATRGGSDSLHIAGYQNTTCLAASARLLRDIMSKRPGHDGRISNEDALRIVQKYPGLIDAAVVGQRVGCKLKGATTAAPAVAYYLIKEKSKYARRADAFFDMLAAGNVPNKRDPVLVLRDAIMNRSISTRAGGSVRAAHICGALIRAWNLWINGGKGSLGGITWIAGQPFPMPE